MGGELKRRNGPIKGRMAVHTHAIRVKVVAGPENVPGEIAPVNFIMEVEGDR